MTSWRLKALIAAIGLSVAGANPAFAQATTQTLTGTLSSDEDVALFNLIIAQPSNVTISTNSYGGGVNLNGTSTTAGGFVPVLSLFDSSGNFIASDGADIHAPGNVDPTTGISDDALLSLMLLAPGNYTLTVSEFYNFPNGNLSDGFFASGQGNFTGPTCSQPNGSFVEIDLVACPQRTNAFVVNISEIAAVPEPATWAMMLVGFAGIGLGLRRRTSPGLADANKLALQ